MIFSYVIYFLISLISGLISYYLTNNIYFFIAVSGIYLISFLIYELSIKRKDRLIKERKKDLSFFIHDFLLSYSSNSNINESVICACKNVSIHLKEENKMLEEFNGYEKLERLTNYFSSSLYQLFLKSIKSSEEEKVAKHKLISFLLEENDAFIAHKHMKEKNISKAACEFFIVWLISFIILIVLRLGINNYFSFLTNSYLYLGGVILYFLILLISIYLFLFAMLGAKQHETR